MSQTRTGTVVTLYARAACEPCAEARALLHEALEDRAARGEPPAVVRHVDVDSDAALQARYGALVPVVAVGDAELPLVTSGRQLRAFLATALPRAG